MTLSSFVRSDIHGGTQFALATPEDDAAICRFLAKQSMPGGKMSLVTCTDPSFFAAAKLMGDDPQVMVAKRSGAIVGLGVRTTRRVWLNGEVVRIGHLSYLRLGQAVRHHRDFLRTGYGFLHDLQRADRVPFHLTAILDDNVAAKRLLEAGLPSLPRYTPLGKVLTFTLRTRRSRPAPRPPADVQTFVRRTLARQDLAPIESPLTDFVPVAERNEILAAAAIWDQRTARQIVLTQVPRLLRTARPLLNMFGASIPAPDKPIDLACVSRLALQDATPEVCIRLLTMLCDKARRSGIDFLAMSLAADHPMCNAVAWWGGKVHLTKSTLYAVHWPDDPGCPPLSSPPYVEAALL
jgi:hypothetical protein